MSDSFLEAIDNLSRLVHPTIAIGAGAQRPGYTEKVLRAADAVDFAEVVVVGKGLQGEHHFHKIVSADVEVDLIRLLKLGRVDGIVRGSARASGAMRELKSWLSGRSIGRIALLESANGFQFLFAPVGVDEGYDISGKLFLIEEGVKLAEKLGVEAKVGILSGGRESDVGRHKNVDRSIKTAREIVETMQSRGLKEIKNYNILIEDAVDDGSNFIVAPEGITGNLIYRTLAFLGAGRGYGAFLVGTDQVYIDTSRVESKDDYIIAIKMACALYAKSKAADQARSQH